MTDLLISAVEALEVAVDDYTHGVFVNVTNPDPEDVPLMTLRYAVIDASTDVAAAMTDGDISLFSSAYATSIIPVEIMPAAAQAEIGSLRALRAARRMHPHPIDGMHEGLRRDCGACEAEDVEDAL